MTLSMYGILQPVQFSSSPEYPCSRFTPPQVPESPCSRFTPRCKSQSCCIFISATPLVFGPNCSITSQYWAQLCCQNGAPGTWVLCSQTPKLQVTIFISATPLVFVIDQWAWINPFRRCQSYSIFISDFYLVCRPNCSMISQYLTQLWWEHDPLNIRDTATSIVQLKYQNLPAVDLLLDISPKAVAYLSVPPPQSLAQIAALHPNIGLSSAAKMASQVHGFYAARPLNCRLESNVAWINPFRRCQSYSIFISDFYLLSGPNCSTISQYLAQLWWEHDTQYVRDTATSIVQLKSQNIPAVDLLLDVSPKAVAYLSVPPPQSLAQIAALHPNIGLSSAAKMPPQVHEFYAARPLNCRLQTNVAWINPFRRCQSYSIFISDFYLVCRPNCSMISQYLTQLWWEHDPLYIPDTATSIVQLKYQNLPAVDLLLDVSPKAVAYLSVPPPQSLAQIAALHPNIGLSSAAKMASQVHGFYAARPLNCRLESNVAWINPFRRCQSYSIFISDFYLLSGPNCSTISQYLAQLWWEHDTQYVRDTATSIVQLKSQNIPAVDLLLDVSPKAVAYLSVPPPQSLAQIAALHPNIGLSSAAKMPPQVHEFYAARPLNCRLQTNVTWINPFRRCQSYSIFISDFYLVCRPNCSMISQYLTQLWWEYDPLYIPDTATSIVQLKYQNLPAVDLLLDVSPKAVAYLSVPPPQSLAQIAALHPNIGLSSAAKMASQVHGFYAARPLNCRLESNVAWINPFQRCQSYSIFISDFYLLSGPNCSTISQYLAQLWWEHDTQYVRDTATSIVQLKSQNIPAVDLLLDVSPKAVAYLSVPPPQSLAQIAALHPNIGLSSAAKMPPQVHEFYAARPLNCRLQTNVAWINPFRRCQSYSIFISDFYLVCRPNCSMISQYLTQLWWEHDPLYIRDTATSIVQLKYQNLPAVDLLLDVSPKAVAYLSVPPPQSLAQIAALHPNIGLSSAAKMAPQVHGFYAARPLNCRLQINVAWINPFRRCQSYSIFISDFYLVCRPNCSMISQYLTQLWWEHDPLYIRDTATSIVQLKYQNLPAVDLLLDVSPKAVAYLSVPPPQSLAQIAALHPNIGLSSAAKMASQVHGFYAARPLNCRLESNVAWINPFQRCQSYSIFISDFYLLSGPNCSTISQYLAQLWWEHDTQYVRDTATSIVQLKSQNIPAVDLLLDVSPKAVAYLSVPPPQSLAQIAALHPNIGLSSAAKMPPQVHEFYAARPLNCRLQTNVTWINPFRRCQSYSIFISDFYLVCRPNCSMISQYLTQLWWEYDPLYIPDTATSIVQLKYQNLPAVDLLLDVSPKAVAYLSVPPPQSLAQIAALHPNIGLSSAAKMASQVHGFYAARPLNCRLESNVAWINPFRRCQSYSIFISDFYLLSGPNCSTISQYLAQLWWEHDTQYVRDTATSIVQLKSQNIPAVDLLLDVSPKAVAYLSVPPPQSLAQIAALHPNIGLSSAAKMPPQVHEFYAARPLNCRLQTNVTWINPFRRCQSYSIFISDFYLVCRPNCSMISQYLTQLWWVSQYLTQLWWEHDPLNIRDTATSIVQLKYQNLPAVDLLLDISPKAVAYLSVPPPQSLAQIAALYPNIGLSSAAKMASQVHGFYAARPLNCRLESNVAWINPFQRCQSYSIFISDFYLLSGPNCSTISQYLAQLWWEHDTQYVRDTATSIVQLKSQNIPAVDLLLDVSPKAVAYLSVPPPQSLAQIAALHPNIGLSSAAKMPPQVHEFYAARPLNCRLQTNVTWINPFRRCQSYSIFISDFYLVCRPNCSMISQYLTQLWWEHDPLYIRDTATSIVQLKYQNLPAVDLLLDVSPKAVAYLSVPPPQSLAQIAALHPNIGLSSAAKMASQVHGFYAARPLNCRLESNVAWINPFQRCQSYSIFISDFYLLSGPNCSTISQYLAQLWWEHDTQYVRDTATSIVQLKSQNIPAVDLLLDVSPKAVAYLSVPPPQSLAQIAALHPNIGLSSAAKMPPQVHEFYAARPLNCRLQTNVTWINPFRRCQSYSIFISDFYLVCRPNCSMISQYLTQLWWEYDPLYIPDTATSIVQLKYQNLPAVDLLLDVSPKAVAYLSVPPPQSLAQIAALHPNIGLSSAAKMASQVHGFYAARPLNCRLESNVAWINPFQRCQSYSIFISDFYLLSGPNCSTISQYLAQLWWEHDPQYVRDTATSIVQLKSQNIPAVDLLLDVSPKAVAYLSVPPPQSLAQIAALHPNIGLSSAAKMPPQVHEFYAARPLNCRLQTNVAWINPFRRCQSYSIFISDFYLVCRPNCSMISQYLTQLWWEHDPLYIRDTATSTVQLKYQNLPAVDLLLDISPKAVAYLSVPPPQSLAQIAALHPNIGLSSAAKMASQVHGFYAARPLNCRLESNVAWINPFQRCQSYSIFISDFYLLSGPNCSTISQYLAQLWWEHDTQYVRDTATSIVQLKSQNIPAVDLLLDVSPKAVAYLSVPPPQSLAQIAALHPNIGLSSAAKMPPQVHEFYAARPLNCRLQTNVTWINPFRRCQSYSIFISDFYLVCRPNCSMISQYLTQLWWEYDPLYIPDTATSIVQLKYQNLPAVDLLLDVSPKAVAYLSVPPPQSLAQIAALHPNIGLSSAAKMASQVHGFYAARPLNCRLESNVAWINPFQRCQSYSIFISDFYLLSGPNCSTISQYLAQLWWEHDTQYVRDTATSIVQLKSQNIPAVDLLLDVSPKAVAYLSVPPPQSLAQIAALHPNIGLSSAAKMASQVHGFYAARPLNCRLQSNVAWINIFHIYQ